MHPTSEFIDSYISAEIPDLEKDPLGYALVAEHMIRGPCGPLKPNFPCMRDGKCTKGFPKTFQETTSIDEQGFATY